MWCNWLTHFFCKEEFRVQVPHSPLIVFMFS
nr:MAG TPA: hypothetical protein [Crassvirales sp.]